MPVLRQRGGEVLRRLIQLVCTDGACQRSSNIGSGTLSVIDPDELRSAAW